MTSIFRSFLVASGIFAVFASVQPALHAQGFAGAFSSFFSDDDDDDDDAPIDLSATVADIYLEKNLVTLLGDVIVEKKEHKITCNKMEIFLKKDEKEEPSDGKKTEPKEAPEVKPAAVTADGKSTADDGKKDDKDDGERQSISKLVCTGDVVYINRKQDKPDEDSMALSNKGNYDDTTGVIVMTEGHTNPELVLPKAIYDDIVRVVGKDMLKQYPIMKQGTNWIVGDRIEIFVKDGNHMRVINSKASSNKAFSTATPKTGSTR